ncbi:BT0820 family HAD-type phosphatase [Christiangramia salexigens]|uniref:Hydrolase n=1 Tax=Christiangramia salexigens TaxID=1913577 RepID=A0A1L3J509_9FLAO|nr:hydrolase [Christiangramia salexigens]APG60201.1 hydrolase [Christiangramia salexigens]
MPNSLTIAVDFDGTIVENRFPEIGKPILFAFESLRKLQEEGHRLILWTYRHGQHLEEAVKFCKDHNLEFYAINKSYPEEDFDDTISRKILADIFIDDRNLGGLKGWGEIYQSLSNNNKPVKKKRKSGLFGRF